MKKENGEELTKLLRRAGRLSAKGKPSRQDRTDQAKRLKELEVENQRLKKIIADLELDLLMWKEFS